jgi:hypothetical protein
MELTKEHLEAIKEAAKTVEYGSITIHISATSNHLDLEVQRRVRIDNEQTRKKIGSFHQVKTLRVAFEPEIYLHTKVFFTVQFILNLGELWQKQKKQEKNLS